MATPLSVVLNELLQNAIDHAFPPAIDLQAEPGRVVVRLENDGERLRATVVDDGVGLPEGFSLDGTSGLGPVDRAHPRHVGAGRHHLARAEHRRRRAAGHRGPTRRPGRAAAVTAAADAQRPPAGQGAEGQEAGEV